MLIDGLLILNKHSNLKVFSLLFKQGVLCVKLTESTHFEQYSQVSQALVLYKNAISTVYLVTLLWTVTVLLGDTC